MNVHFRDATPKDVDAAIPLIFSSGPGAFDYIFSPKPGQAQEFLRYTFQDGAGEFGYKNHIVGELDGKVVAIGAAFDGESTLNFFLAAGDRSPLSTGWLLSPSFGMDYKWRVSFSRQRDVCTTSLTSA